jgi:hypothetical protein
MHVAVNAILFVVASVSWPGRPRRTRAVVARFKNAELADGEPFRARQARR